VWLNRFSDHRSVQAQMSAVTAAWLYRPKTFIAALLLVGCLAIWRIARSRFSCFRDPRTRLFGVLFLVVFALTQHNLFMRPMEPIHFAHGYDWVALFFIGAPVLIALLDYLLKLPRPGLRVAALTLLLGVFLLDNAAWLVKIAFHNEFLVSLSKDESGALTWLSRNVKEGDMVICADVPVSYLVSTYTPGRSWFGHEKNTPYMQQREEEAEQAFSQGIILPEWKRQGVYFVSPTNWTPPAELSLKQLYANAGFSIWAAQ